MVLSPWAQNLITFFHSLCTCDFVILRNEQDYHLSKRLAWLLRHGATKEGLQISGEGYVVVEEILKNQNYKNKFDLKDIERIVNKDKKQRFSLRCNGISKKIEIKANQGHTIKEINDPDLISIVEPKFKTVVHGTYLKYWENIKIVGLSRMKRNHIHFAKGTLGDRNIISGLRVYAQVYIFIDLKLALLDGIKFYESKNGVILTPGNNCGILPTKYFSKVVGVKSGNQLYP